MDQIHRPYPYLKYSTQISVLTFQQQKGSSRKHTFKTIKLYSVNWNSSPTYHILCIHYLPYESCILLKIRKIKRSYV